MRFRGLAVFPLLYAAVFIAVSWSLLGSESLASFLVGQRLLVRVLALVGCFAAMSVFERGDHLRRAWLLLGSGTVLILIRDLLRLNDSFKPANAGPWETAILSSLVVLANLVLLAGVWMLSRAWKKAALLMPGGRSGFLAVGAITAVLAVVVAGPAAVENARKLGDGDWTYLGPMVSAIADILSLSLISPLLLTAVSLRGSLFSWPWALITAGRVSWLLYDAAAALDSGLLAPDFPLAEVFRGLGENFAFAAGLAQFFVVRHVRRATLARARPVEARPVPE
ncbi:MAG TPA: hypothetical protein VF789_29630 [Thermoanaerobaculia bacterium]